MSQRDRFSNLKGSLGFAFGSEVHQFDQASAVESQKKQNQKSKEDELSIHHDNAIFSKKDLVYSLRIFIVAI